MFGRVIEKKNLFLSLPMFDDCGLFLPQLVSHKSRLIFYRVHSWALSNIEVNEA